MTFFVVVFPDSYILSSSQSEVNSILGQNNNVKVVAFCTSEEAYNYVRELETLANETVCTPGDVYIVNITTEYKSNAFYWKAEIEDSCQNIQFTTEEKSFENEAYCIIEGILAISSKYKEKDLRFRIPDKQIVDLFNNFKEKRKTLVPSRISRMFEKLSNRNITLSIT